MAALEHLRRIEADMIDRTGQVWEFKTWWFTRLFLITGPQKISGMHPTLDLMSSSEEGKWAYENSTESWDEMKEARKIT